MNKILSGRTAWRIHRGTRSGLLVDGRDYYLSFFEAARRARRSVLLLGWQFDSDVQLVRGDDVPRGIDPADVELLRFLDNLCRSRPELEVRVLAWDHSVVFALEREAFQKLVFDAGTCDRFHFHWDSTVPLGGSHHQKIAIVDGRIAFTGSQDLCQERWDSSSHLARHPLRIARSGSGYKPYHEVQAALAGPPARSLVELFANRWRHATGEELDPARLVYGGPVAWGEASIPLTVPMPRAIAGLSRTVPPGEGREPTREIRELYTRAIQLADRMIYIETQYLTSCTIRDALLERMRARGRPRLEIVIVLPHKPERLKEELTVTLPQADTLRALAEVAAENGHRLGVYNVAATDEGGADVNVYIHSKLMIVDDRFLTVGSANLTNRSMSLDSELNVCWEATPDDRALHAAIRRVRARLLFEHLGEAARARVVARPEGLVSRLDETIAAGVGRLRHHRATAPSAFARAVQELACEVLDPTDGAEPIALPARPSAA